MVFSLIGPVSPKWCERRHRSDRVQSPEFGMARPGRYKSLGNGTMPSNSKGYVSVMENESTPGDRLNNFTGEERARRWWPVPLTVTAGVAGAVAAAFAYASVNSPRLELAPVWVLAVGAALTPLCGALAWA